MIPIKLTMKNIGPFNGTAVVDFTQYKGIFLIAGDTGAGKTTILDAICYAFYGRTPSYAKFDIRSLRSDFVDSDAVAYIDFTFKIPEGDAEKIYEIYRELPDTKKGETVKLFVLEDGEKKEFIAKTNETNERIKSIIKLEYSEFSKIILLPQGMFADFIKQKSSDKEGILKEIFDVEKFSRFISRVKSKSEMKLQELSAIGEQIKRLQETYDDIQYEETKIKIETRIKELNAKIKTKTEKLETAKAQKLQAENFLIKQNELHEAQQRFDELQLEEKNIADLQYKVDMAGKLAPLVEKLNRVDELQINIKNLNEKLNGLQNEYQQCNTELQNLASEENLKFIAEKKEALENLIKKEERLRSAEEIFSELQTQKQNLAVVKNKLKPKEIEVQNKMAELEKTEKEISVFNVEIEKLDERSAQVEALRKQKDTKKEIISLLEKFNEKQMNRTAYIKNVQTQSELLRTAEKNILEKEQTLKILKEKKESDEAKSLAVKLALSLKENEACPVCGALHHPKLASLDMTQDTTVNELNEKILLGEKEIERLKGEREKIFKSFSNFEARAETLNDELKVLEKNFSELNFNVRGAELAAEKQQYDELLIEFNNAIKYEQSSKQAITKKAQEEQKQKIYTDTVEKLRNEISELKNKQAEITATIKSATEQLKKSLGVTKLDDSIVPSDELAKTIAEKNQCTDIIRTHNEELQTTEKLFEKLKTQIEETNNNAQSLSADLFEKTSELESACKKIGIAQDEISRCSLADAAVNEYTQKISAFNKNKIALNEKIKNLEAELKNIPQFNMAELVKKIEMLDDEISQMREQVIIESQTLIRLDEQHRSYVQLCAEHTKLSKDAESLKILFDKVSGTNPKRIKFDTWRLSHLFKQVITYANSRFIKISNGRYFLEVSSEGQTAVGNQKLGLDLLVYDSHTGKTRPVSTLSGGETFIASLCIALGLADTVTNNAGGIKINCMFIDEGFDTLDPGNLARVFDSLDFVTKNESLHMLGIISHLSELETRILQQLRIRKTNVGSIIEQ